MNHGTIFTYFLKRCSVEVKKVKIRVSDVLGRFHLLYFKVHSLCLLTNLDKAAKK